MGMCTYSEGLSRISRPLLTCVCVCVCVVITKKAESEIPTAVDMRVCVCVCVVITKKGNGYVCAGGKRLILCVCLYIVDFSAIIYL